MGDEDRRTLWCGNLAEKASEELLYELFLQAGPLEKVSIPKDRDGRQRNFGFITYIHEVSVPYARELFRGTEIFQRTLSLQTRGGQRYLPIKADLPPMRDFPVVHPDIPRQFEEMANHLAFNSTLPNVPYNGKNNMDRPDRLPNLSAASLQGNWSTRHHPYQRDNFRDKGHFNSKRRSDKHWDEQPRDNHLRFNHFNDEHRGNYGKSHKGHKGNR